MDKPSVLALQCFFRVLKVEGRFRETLREEQGPGHTAREDEYWIRQPHDWEAPQIPGIHDMATDTQA